MLMLTYKQLFFLDAVTWTACVVLMLRFGRLTALHPASLYFFFHAYTFTFRLFQLANGSPTLYTTWGAPFRPVSGPEIHRAALLALASLVIMTLVWLVLANRDKNPGPAPQQPDSGYRPFSEQLLWRAAIVLLPAGLTALVLLRLPLLIDSSGLALGNWAESSYLISMTQWFGISLLALMFYYGFRPILVIPFIAYLLIGLLTFEARTLIIIPALFAGFLYMRREQRAWPDLKVAAPIVIIVLFFFAGKDFGPQLRNGDFSGAWKRLVQGAAAVQEGEHGDTLFMDQFAVALSQVDHHKRFYYGRTYANLLLLPIPRPLWPDKPGLADWQKEIETPGRPTGTIGAIVTAPGEAYANFGHVGIVLYAILLAWLLYKLYVWMVRAPYFSIVNFWSLGIYAILIQLFRDGWISLFTYQVTVTLPLTLIILLHFFTLRHRTNWREKTTEWVTIFDNYNEWLDHEGHTRTRSRMAARTSGGPLKTP
jgi:hypothetical protein